MLNKIKEFASKKGLSIAEIEKRAGLANGTIGKWDNSSPTLKSLEKVADVLEISVKRLID